MLISSLTLTEEQIAGLDDLMFELDKHDLLKEQFRLHFKAFCQNHVFGKNMTPTDITRLIRQPSSRRYQRIVLLLDFILSGYFEISVRDQFAKYASDYDLVLEKYAEMRASIANLIEKSDDPFESIRARSGTATNRVPVEYCRKYIGYRRSSRKGEVVRYFLEIKKPNETGEVVFVNEYHRLHSHWVVNGTSTIWKDTLYLLGFADAHKSEKGLGYRMFALNETEHADILVGPIISMDSVGPICARTVLVPLDAHDLTFEQRSMTETELNNNINSPASAKNTRDYIAEIKANLRNVFPNYPENHIFKLISNLSLTVIRTQPSEFDKLIEQELRYRKLLHEKKRDLQGLGSAIVRAMSQLSDDDILNVVQSGPKGDGSL